MRLRRFSLRALIGLTTVSCGLAAASSWLGVVAVAALVVVAVVLVVVPVAWSWAYVRAPSLTLHATVLIGAGVIGFSLLACGLVRARQEARRTYSLYRLNQITDDLAERRGFDPRRRYQWQGE